MNYKEELDKIKAVIFGEEKAKEDKAEDVVEEVALAEEAEAPVEEAPAETPAYITIQEFNTMKEDLLGKVTEMLSAAMEMINQTEKNAVPQEMSKEEEVELSVEPLVHDPEGLEKEVNRNFKIGAGRPKTVEDRVLERLFKNKPANFYN